MHNPLNRLHLTAPVAHPPVQDSQHRSPGGRSARSACPGRCLDKLAQVSPWSILHHRASSGKPQCCCCCSWGRMAHRGRAKPALPAVYPGELFSTFSSHSSWNFSSPNSHGSWVTPALSLLGTGYSNLARAPAWKSVSLCWC